MVRTFSMAAGIISQLNASTSTQLALTNGKKEDYSQLSEEVAEMIVKLANDKAKMTHLATVNYELFTELTELKSLLLLFGTDSKLGLGVEKGTSSVRKVYGPKIAVANERAKSLFTEAWDQEWPEEAILCVYAGQMAIPLIKGYDDPEDDESETVYYTPKNAQLDIPQFKLTLSETVIMGGIKIAGFRAEAVKGTSTRKGKFFFTGRVANFVKNENGQISDTHSPGLVLEAALNGDATSIATYIEPARFGGGKMIKLFTDETVPFGIYPIVCTSRERRRDETKGSSWVNTYVTVYTPQGEETFRIDQTDADAFLPTLIDLYPSTDENGNESQPQRLIFDEGLRAIAYFGVTEYKRKDGKPGKKAQLALVAVDDNTPQIAPPNTVFDPAEQKFVAIKSKNENLISDVHDIILDGDDDDGDDVDMREADKMAKSMAAMAANTTKPKTKSTKVAVTTIDSDEEDDDFDDM